MTSDAERCSACGGEGLAQIGRVPGFVEGTGFPVLQCTDCLSQSVRPLSVPEGIYDAIYRAGEGFAGYARYHRYAKVVAALRHPLRFLSYSEGVYWAVAEALRERAAKGQVRVLEIGSGLGYLTASLRKEGHLAWGVDLSNEAADAARRRYGPWYQAGDTLYDAMQRLDTGPQFDMVVALELIEHLPNPLAFLQEVSGYLHPGGEILLSTPNRANYAELALWCSSLPPVHLHWFSEQGMHRLGERAGLAASLTDFTGFNRLRGRGQRPAPWPQMPHEAKLSADLDPLVAKPIVGVSAWDHLHDLPFGSALLGAREELIRAARRLQRTGGLKPTHPRVYASRTDSMAVRLHPPAQASRPI